MRTQAFRSRSAAFAPRFLAAFGAAFAVFTLLPSLLWLGPAGLLTAGKTVGLGGWWLLEAALGATAALLGATLALHRRRERLWRHLGALPQGGTVPGALAGVVAGLAQTFALASNINTFLLDVIYYLGLRPVIHLGPAVFAVIWWLAIVGAGFAAGAAAIALLYFPWLAAADLRNSALGREATASGAYSLPPNEALQLTSAGVRDLVAPRQRDRVV